MVLYSQITVQPLPEITIISFISLQSLSFGLYSLIIVLSRGLVVDSTEANPYSGQAWRHKMADAMTEFNDYVANEPRVEVPLFDGLGLIRLKDRGR